MPLSAEDSLHCPTCGAAQAWSDACRRCGCDLRLLRAAAAAYRSAHERCLSDLRAGRLAAAHEQARRCAALRPGVASRRLLAICALARKDWAGAKILAQGTIAEQE